MKHVLALAMVVALVLGCTTTRTLPDGTVEVEQPSTSATTIASASTCFIVSPCVMRRL